MTAAVIWNGPLRKWLAPRRRCHLCDGRSQRNHLRYCASAVDVKSLSNDSVREKDNTVLPADGSTDVAKAWKPSHARGRKTVALAPGEEARLAEAVAKLMPAAASGTRPFAGNTGNELDMAKAVRASAKDEEVASKTFGRRRRGKVRASRAAEESEAGEPANEAFGRHLPSAAGKAAMPPLPTSESNIVEATVSTTMPQQGSAAAALLPLTERPDQVPAHRNAGAQPPVKLEAIRETTKFRERFALLLEQLAAWGYDTHSPKRRRGPSGATPKATLTAFARANPDLLAHLPVRELHIFVKKFKNFKRRALDRKRRAASQRLINLYVDYHVEPTFNGQPEFQDVTRLLNFVSQSDFSDIEALSPGIVAAASDLVPCLLDAAAAPPSSMALADHSRSWYAAREETLVANASLANACSRATPSNHRRLREVRSRIEADEDEQRLEQLESRLTTQFRSKAGPARVRAWSPWDSIRDKENAAVADAELAQETALARGHRHSVSRSKRASVSHQGRGQGACMSELLGVVKDGHKQAVVVTEGEKPGLQGVGAGKGYSRSSLSGDILLGM